MTTRKSTRAGVLPSVPNGLDPQSRAFFEAVRESVQTMQGQRGDVADKALTLRDFDDFKGKAGRTLLDRLTSRVVNTLNPELGTMRPPTGLGVIVAFDSVLLYWDASKYPAYSFTQVFRQSVPITAQNPNPAAPPFSDQFLVGTESSTRFNDTITTGFRYFYWIRHVDSDFRPTAFTGPVACVAAELPSAIVDRINSEIRGDGFIQFLSSRIEVPNVEPQLVGIRSQILNIEQTRPTSASVTDLVAVSRADAIAAAEVSSRAYTDNATSALRSEYTIKVNAQGQVAGIGLTAGGVTGSAITFLAERFTFVNPIVGEHNLGLGLRIQNGTLFIRDAVAVNMTADNLTFRSGNVVNLAVTNRLLLPSGIITEENIAPEFLRTLLRATLQGSSGGNETIVRTVTFSPVGGTGSWSLNPITGGGQMTRVSIDAQAFDYHTTSIMLPAFAAPRIDFRIRRNGVNVLIPAVVINGFNASTDWRASKIEVIGDGVYRLRGSTRHVSEPNGGGTLIHDYESYLEVQFGFDAGIFQGAGTFTLEIIAVNGSIGTANLRVNVHESSGLLASVSSVPWSGVVNKPTTLAGYGITDALPNGEIRQALSVGLNGINNSLHVWQAGATTLELFTSDATDPTLTFHRRGHTATALRHSANGGLTLIGGALRSDSFEINGAPNILLRRGIFNSAALNLSTVHGNVDIGAMNSGFCHFHTDRPDFYFNRPIRVESAITVYNSSNGGIDTSGLFGNGSRITGVLLSTGGTVTGPIEIASAVASNWNEGLRITAAHNGWAGVTFGSTGLQGAPTNGWFAARNPSNQFIITPAGSDPNLGLTLNSGGNALWRNNVLAHSGNFQSLSLMHYSGFTLDANTMGTNTTGFTYAVGAPYVGPIVRIGANTAYDLQINAQYNNNGLGIGYRTRNGDISSWNPWRRLANYEENAYLFLPSWIRGAPSAGMYWDEGTHLLSVGNGHLNLYGGGTDTWIRFGTSGNTTRGFVYATAGSIGFLNASGNWSLRVDDSGNAFATDHINTSDLRTKSELDIIPNALSKVSRMVGYTFKRNGSDRREAGFIAQDLEAVLPEGVVEFDDIKRVSNSAVIALLIEAVKDLSKKVSILEAISHG